jgi:SpoVK/Ycf46/Vps4 family AAA+-type ATPase
VGGLDGLKTWIGKRRRAYGAEAAAYGLPTPKGILLVGIPGTGKSLCAKAVGTALGVPTLRLDVGALFQSLVGESEARTRDALQLAEAMAPCVLFVDEIDKGLAGTASGGGAGDSGVARRVLGSILTWMQDRPADRPVFVVATANQVDGLPPELLRKGRFDELFAVDLPTPAEREAIFRIHLGRRKRDPADYDLARLAEATPDYTGSEIEAIVVEALYHAFDLGREITTEDLLAAARAVVPLAVTAKDTIEAVRRWGATRARAASTRPATYHASAGPGARQLD